jgi:hypothetical protein
MKPTDEPKPRRWRFQFLLRTLVLVVLLLGVLMGGSFAAWKAWKARPIDVLTVDDGFFFHDGQYIDPPYTMTIRGDTLSINGVVVSVCRTTPVPEWAKGAPKPPPPAGSFSQDMDVSAWLSAGHCGQLSRYMYATKPTKEATQEILAYLRSLPFVLRVEEPPGVSSKFELHCRGGKSVLIGTFPPCCEPRTEEIDSQEVLRRRAESYGSRFQQGHVTILFTKAGGELGCGSPKIRPDFAKLIALMCRGDLTAEEKVDRIVASGYLDMSRSVAIQFVCTFSASSELERRLARYGVSSPR